MKKKLWLTTSTMSTLADDNSNVYRLLRMVYGADYIGALRILAEMGSIKIAELGKVICVK